jgi:hypothetical protein
MHSYGECSNCGPVMQKTEMSEMFFARSEKSKYLSPIAAAAGATRIAERILSVVSESLRLYYQFSIL